MARRFVAPRVGILAFLVSVALAAVPVNAQPSAATYQPPRSFNGKPDLTGIWQAVNTASWDIQAHNAEEGVPPGLGVVEGNDIPYQAWAREKKSENHQNRTTADPLHKCFLPGVPRITYMPFPFEILQTPTHIGIAYEYNHTTRTISVDGSQHSGVDDLWMGDSRGHWEADTLVVEVRGFNDRTWFDRAGNFHSDALRVIERYTRISTDIINYEATIEDSKVFTRPWKMSMPLYRRQEKNLRLLDYVCLEFREPFFSVDEAIKSRGK